METEVVKTAIQVDFNTIITAVSALIVVGVNVMLWLTKIVKIEQNVKNLRSEFDHHRQETKEEIRNLDGRIDKLDGRIDKLDGRIDNLSTKIDTLVSAVSYMQGVLQTKFRSVESEDSLQPVKTPPSVINDKPRKVK